MSILTSEEIIKEYIKCVKDPIYAIETYLEVNDLTQGGYVPFKLLPRQIDVIKAYEKYQYNLITKPRQAGVSTITQAYLAIKSAFADPGNPETILVIANKLRLAQKFVRGIKDFLLQLPRWVWGYEYYGDPSKEKSDIFLSDSKIELELPNHTKIIAVATSEDALRGYTPTYLIFDEAAFIDKGDEVYSAAMSSCATGGRAILISTPNGMDPLYYKTYEQAKSGINNYNIVEMRWYEDPRYNKDLRWIKKNEDGKIIEEIKEYEFNIEKFKEKIKKGYKPTSTWYEKMCMSLNNNPRKIAQELDVTFIGSGGNVIHDDDIKFQEENNVMEPKWIKGSQKEYWIWEEPKEGHQYILGCDVSRGDGDDFSAIVIIDVTTMTQVMEYRGKIQPDLLAEIVYEYGNLYKAYSVVDIAGGMGVSTVLKLLELDYKYLHYDTPRGKILSSKKADLDNFNKNNKIPGFNATGVRIPMISNLEQMVRTNQIKVRSSRIINEMKSFIYKNGRPDHMDGYNDDLLMALSMALWVLEHSFKKLEKLENINKAILDGWKVVSSGDVISSNKNNNNGNKPQNNKIYKKYYNNNNNNNNMGNYLWLFGKMK